MELKFVRRRVPRCSRHEAFDVAAVAQLALSIAPDDIVTQRLGHPKFVLCGRALLADRRRCTTSTISQMTLGEGKVALSGWNPTPWWHSIDQMNARNASLPYCVPNMVMCKKKGLGSSFKYSAML